MLKWRAYFRNQHVLEQYSDSGKERLFREVLDRQNELERLELVEDGKIYSINLLDGSFYITGVRLNLITEAELGIPLRNAKYRIIYYKRVQREVSGVNVGSPKIICYLLGWQSTANGKNIQRILQIYPTGEIFLQTK